MGKVSCVKKVERKRGKLVEGDKLLEGGWVGRVSCPGDVGYPEKVTCSGGWGKDKLLEGSKLLGKSKSPGVLGGMRGWGGVLRIGG